jgi:HD superfamily phosphohydrolase
MDFLRESRRKIVRTRLYGDQEFTRFELELLHTPIVQRLYNLKQLGFTDRVFPDAIHSRFNHIIGVTHVVEDMAKRLIAWLRLNSSEQFDYEVGPAKNGQPTASATIAAAILADQLTSKIPSLRLMALLHDLTHAAFGHTLEDEVNVFDEKHDDPRRQARFFDALIAQLLYLWCIEERLHTFDASVLEKLSDLSLSPEKKRETNWAEELAEYLSADDRRQLAEHLRDLELAFQLLLHLDFMHKSHLPVEGISTDVLVANIAAAIDGTVKPHEFVLHRDMFMVDLVGNTICADLLDYARRDADNAGLRIQFDDRFLRYLCVTSVKGDLSPTQAPCIRTAIQIFTDKMRHDVLSEMSGILKARYLINERVVFHPTKCAAGAMLGTAVQLLGLRDLPGWMQVLGDQEFLGALMAVSANLENVGQRLLTQSTAPKQQKWVDIIRTAWALDPRMAEVLEKAIVWIFLAANPETPTAADIELLSVRARGARNVLWRLRSRRFPRLAYRLRYARQTGGASDETIAETYSRPKDRYSLERKIEEMCNLPMGSIFIHCPRRKTTLKVAEVLVVGSDLKKAAQLRNLTEISPEGLAPYEQEIVAIQDMYRSIWQFHCYLDISFWDKQPVVEWALQRELGFQNDRLLSQELSHDYQGAYHLIAGRLLDKIPAESLPQVIKRVDEEVPTRMRLGDKTRDLETSIRGMIREVIAEENETDEPQLGLPGMGS